VSAQLRYGHVFKLSLAYQIFLNAQLPSKRNENGIIHLIRISPHA